MKTTQFSSLAVFGDGLSDMGRWGNLTNKLYPPAVHGFYESRWTNGKVWIEHVADSMGMQLNFDNNFALGGATTGLYNINEALRPALQLHDSIPLMGMLAQVQAYLAGNPAISNETLFVLWAGGHDIGNLLDYGQPDLEQFPPSENYQTAVKLLAEAGAKKILLGTMPDMGFAPVYHGTEKQAIASTLCHSLNDGLKALQQAYSTSETQILLLDGAKIFAEADANPGKYGFTHKDAFLPFDIIDFSRPLEIVDRTVPNKQMGLNPDEFMNWWAVSASAKMHRIIADEAISLIQQ